MKDLKLKQKEEKKKYLIYYHLKVIGLKNRNL